MKIKIIGFNHEKVLKKYISILVFILNLVSNGFSQLPEYHAQVFGEEHGLGSDLISEFFMDKQEFVWLMTRPNLQRFDGRNIKRYPFPENITFAICDTHGIIWVQSGQTIYRNKSDWKGFEKIKFDTSGGVILRGIFQLINHPVTVLTNKGLYFRNEKLEKFEKIEAIIPTPRSRSHSQWTDTSESVIFYSSPGAICALNLVTYEYKTLPFESEVNYLFAVTPSLAVLTDYLNNSYWFDFAKGEIRPIDAKKYGLSPDLHKTEILGLFPISEKQYLVNTKFGLCKYNLDEDSFRLAPIYAAGKPLDNNKRLRKIFKDKHGVLWAHSGNKILTIRSLENSLGLLRNYNYEPPGQWNEDTKNFTEDAKGNIWFGSFNGFNKLNLKTGIITAYPPTEDAKDKLNHPFVNGMSSDQKYIIVGPTYNGVWLFNPINNSYHRPAYANDTVKQSLESDFIDYIGKMRNGDHIICGRLYLYCMKANTYRVDFIRFDGDQSNMNTVRQDSTGRIWVGTNNGIFCFNEKYEILPVPRFLSKEVVISIFQKDEKNMLVGTMKGLHNIILNEDSFLVKNIPIKAENLGITSIFMDKLHRFWIGTHDGLYLGDNQLNTFQKFDFSDNIQSYFFNGGSYRASNGMLFLGGQNGINYFYPEKIETRKRSINIYIQSLKINDGDSVLFWPKGRLEFSHNLNTFTFELVSPYYNNAGKLQYRYRIQSEPWIESGNSFRLNNLLPGDYHIEVSMSENGLDWFEAESPIVLKILYPYWKTWWFKISLALLLSAIIYGLYLFRIRQLKGAEKIKTELAESRMQALRAQMNPHFIFNCLNSINRYIIKSDIKTSSLYLTRFAKLIRLILDNSEHKTVILSNEIEALKLYIDMESLRFDHKFSFEVTVDPNIDSDQIEIPPLLIQPYVENAIWHGLLHKDSGGHLSVKISQQEENLICEVTDNGIGREKAKEYKSQNAPTRSSIGMKLTEERLNITSTVINKHGSCQIIDLKDDKGEACGTTVIITIPI